MREDWIEVELGEVCEIISGKNQKQVENPNGKYPIYGSGGIFGYADEYLCEPGTTVIGRKGTINSPIYINQKFWNVDTAFGISPATKIKSKYVYYFSLGFNFKKLDKSTTIPSLAKRDLLKIRFLLAPLPEQRAIVAKIEQLFSELDNGVAKLKAAKDKLEIFRQAVLQKAFEGELTKEWRKKHSHELDSAEVLLKKIKLEQEEHFQQQLNDWTKTVKQWEADGKLTKKPAKPRKAQEPEPITTDELKLLPQIASSWKYRRLAQIATIGSGMSVSKNRKLQNPIEVPYLRVANVQRGKLVLDNMKHMKIERNDLPKLQLHKWDILFNEGGDRDKLGRGWIWESQVEPCITQNHVFRVTTYTPDAVTAKFISYWGNTFGRHYFEKTGKQTTNLASINKTVLSNFPIPLVSKQEQTQIVQEIETRLSVCDNAIANIEESLIKSEALRQSILKKAFAGKLLTNTELQACRNEPDWEPAAKLLERIKNNKQSTPRKKSTT